MNVTSVLTGVLVLVGGFMTFLIMLQEGKGGGLTALGGTKAAGIEGVTNPIRRATGYMAGLFFLLAIVLAIINRPSKTSDFFTESEKAGDISTKASEPVLGAGPGGLTTPVAPITPANKVETSPTVSVTPTPTPANPADAPKASEAVKPTDAPKTDAPKTDAPKPVEALKPVETPATPATPATK